MNAIIALLGFFLLSPSTPPPDQEIDSTEDEKKVKTAVISWADSTFFSHSDYKFEHFRAFYTDEYFIAVMRARMFKDKLTTLERTMKNGNYKKSEEDYKQEHVSLSTSYSEAQHEVDNFVERAEYYSIHFWSNIQTNDGITVYYEHIVKVDNNYQVIDAVENSAIGKKSNSTKILYKKDVQR
ncbi:MAG: hypothetical protein MI810_15800 [Flavobacteriales bacterium]|nr:hypothetical protein [Flavobacteriales bacterium]